ncbi:calmodulin [Anaeramoeba ignava]|uniref:Calmodulin n=1 Tax=Anaeramoeba ignava TaxID=1746090 RepID=A0A9Q0RG53_ANAIG|nr:calmodulin [Anaeramoeba ignava]
MDEIVTEEQQQKYQDVFNLFDKNCDGFLNRDEVSLAIRSLDKIVSEKWIQEKLEQLDPENKGLDFQNFITLVSQENEFSKEQIEEAFNILNKDQDGLIPLEELEYVLTNMGEPVTKDDLEKVLEPLTKSGADKINVEELKSLLLEGLN